MSPSSAAKNPTPNALAAAPASMLSPGFDTVCVGGASIALALTILAFDLHVPVQKTYPMIVVAFLINYPHFMASYALLYGARDRRRDYPRVSLYVPLVLLAWMLFGLAVHASNPMVLDAMITTGALLLAWHYTGQAWGMMASFGMVAGLRFSDRERMLIRANLTVLLAWHAVWAVVFMRGTSSSGDEFLAFVTPERLAVVYDGVSLLALASSLLGLGALLQLARRTGATPPLRVIVPWVAIHVWYVLMYHQPTSIFWVQIAHALQYLIFPVRVQMNRELRRTPEPGQSLRRSMLRYYLLLFVAGVIVIGIVPQTVGAGIQALGYGAPPVAVAVVMFVNIHHYFIDNVIWKIRNPIVRDDLFSHLGGRG